MVFWTTLTAGALIALVTLIYVVWPLVSEEVPPYVDYDDQLTELIARKDAALSAIKELEFDYRTGKISEQDFERFNQRLRRQAIGYLQQIEKVAPQASELDETLEIEIARHRKTVNGSLGPAAPTSLDEFASEDAKPVTDMSSNGDVEDDTSVNSFCTQCGHLLQPTDKFCPRCGTLVPGKEPVSSS